MEERIITTTPAMLVGISTNKPYPKHAIFYDGNKIRLAIPLAKAMRSKKVRGEKVPGEKLYIAFDKSITMYCVPGAKIDVIVGDHDLKATHSPG